MWVIHYTCFKLNVYSTQANPYSNFYHSQNVHSLLQHLLVKLLNIEGCCSLSHVLHENVTFFSRIGHIWPPKTIIKSISLTCTYTHIHTHQSSNYCRGLYFIHCVVYMWMLTIYSISLSLFQVCICRHTCTNIYLIKSFKA